MTNEKTLKKQEELFAKDCNLINLKYEYMGYTGQEKWAIVSELYKKRQNNNRAGRNQSNLSVPYGVAKSRDTGEKTRRSGCHKSTADTVYPLKRKVAVIDGGFSFSGSIQEVIKFRE